MTKTNEANPCRCRETTCGCGGQKARCTCGEVCACKDTCGCGPACACAAKK